MIIVRRRVAVICTLDSSSANEEVVDTAVNDILYKHFTHKVDISFHTFTFTTTTKTISLNNFSSRNAVISAGLERRKVDINNMVLKKVYEIVRDLRKR